MQTIFGGKIFWLQYNGTSTFRHVSGGLIKVFSMVFFNHLPKLLKNFFFWKKWVEGYHEMLEVKIWVNFFGYLPKPLIFRKNGSDFQRNKYLKFSFDLIFQFLQTTSTWPLDGHVLEVSWLALFLPRGLRT